jgi:hypothetical protein
VRDYSWDPFEPEFAPEDELRKCSHCGESFGLTESEVEEDVNRPYCWRPTCAALWEERLAA